MLSKMMQVVTLEEEKAASSLRQYIPIVMRLYFSQEVMHKSSRLIGHHHMQQLEDMFRNFEHRSSS